MIHPTQRAFLDEISAGRVTVTVRDGVRKVACEGEDRTRVYGWCLRMGLIREVIHLEIVHDGS